MSHDEGKMVRVSKPEGKMVRVSEPGVKVVRVSEPGGKMVRVSEPPGDGGMVPPLDSVWILSGPGFIRIWMDQSGFGWIRPGVATRSGWILDGPCMGWI